VLDVDGTVFQALQAVGVSPARNSMQPRGLMLYEQQTPSGAFGAVLKAKGLI
jgi:hypothetical protein